METYTLNKDEIVLIAQELRYKNNPVLYRFYETLLNDPDSDDEIKHTCLIYFYTLGYSRFHKVKEEIAKHVTDTVLNFIKTNNNSELEEIAIAFLDQIISRKNLEKELIQKESFDILSILKEKWSRLKPHQHHSFN